MAALPEITGRPQDEKLLLLSNTARDLSAVHESAGGFQ